MKTIEVIFFYLFSSLLKMNYFGHFLLLFLNLIYAALPSRLSIRDQGRALQDAETEVSHTILVIFVLT